MKNKKVDLDKTDLMDYVPIEETPEFIERKKAILEKLPTYQERFHEAVDLPEEVMKQKQLGKYNVPMKMDMDKNIHMPNSEVSKYITKQQAKSKLFRELSDILSSPVAKNIGKAAKFVPLLGVATDVLAQDEVGDPEEEKEIKQMKKQILEKRREEKLPEEDRLILQKMREKAEEPLSVEDMVMTNRRDLDAPIASHRFEALTGTKTEEPKEEQIARKTGPRSNRYMKLMRHMYGEK